MASCEEGNHLFCGEAAHGIIPRVQRLLAREMSRGSLLFFFIIDSHDPDDLEFLTFPRQTGPPP
ncbi:MAG: hypothetical protein QGH66_08335 [Dehalococcoidia bacterium]|nr:hypothetical protein [Dehalococcoidia bacterium]MDP7470700.1 hypothetical protein [Dehalococcoidia bacterium]